MHARFSFLNTATVAAVVLLLLAHTAASSNIGTECNLSPSVKLERKIALRVASFNAALNRFNAGDLLEQTKSDDVDQLRRVAATLQHIDADVVLLNEVDFDVTGQTYQNFRTNYLHIPQTQYGSETAVPYPYYYAAPSNTGILSHVDINADGNISLPADAFGFGFFPGQFAFAVYSKYPIAFDQIRTFQKFLWKHMPDNLIPDSVYAEEVIDVFRLSSKNHVDVPIQIPGGAVVHILASHPTPPVFDSDADENGRRNADEIRFWTDYITPGRDGYIYDDAGVKGGLEKDSIFFVCGDLNADPYDGDGRRDAISTLLSRYNIIDPLPSSVGALQSTNNLNTSVGDPRFDTSFFSPFVGNLRVDYVLPSSNIELSNAQVFWPADSDALFPLVNGTETSDHRAVFVDTLI